MITAIEIENFKAFGERQRIEFRPITLLFGPNSGGKSSIIHALHLAREIFVHGNVNVHRPEAGGEMVDLGGIHSFIHGKKLGKHPVKLKFEMSLTSSDLPDFPLPGDLEMRASRDPLDGLKTLRSASIEIEIAPDAMPFVSSYTVWLNDVARPFAKVASVTGQPYATISDIFWDHPVVMGPSAIIRHNLEQRLLTNREIQQILAGHLTKLRDQLKSETSKALPPQLRFDGKRISLERFLKVVAKIEKNLENFKREEQDLLEKLSPENFNEPSPLASLLERVWGDALQSGFQLQLLQHRSALPPWNRSLEVHNSFATAEESWEDELPFHELAYQLTRLITGPGQVLRGLLENLRHIGPLRTLPPRGWQPPAVSLVSGWSSGNAAWQLIRESPGEWALESVNRWLSAADCLDTEYSLAKVAFRELPSTWIEALLNAAGEDSTLPGDLAEDLRNVPEKYRIDLSYRGRRLELQDVGVGISQVLPVLVGVLDTTSQFVSLEQPELHLHPKQQAALGDLFIEAMHEAEELDRQAHAREVQRRREDHARVPEGFADLSPLELPPFPDRIRRVFLIETHSEYLILRIMRRIRETSAAASPPRRSLDRTQLSILHVHHEDGASRVLPIHLDKDGDLLQPWPDTFFDQDAMERFGKDEKF